MRPDELIEVAEWASAALGWEVRLAMTTDGLAPGNMTAGERRQFQVFDSPQRRADWSRGRAALKNLLGGADTSTVTFPHPWLSISHSGSVAVAAALPGLGDAACGPGLGVDYEASRSVDDRAIRFFLHPHEVPEAGASRSPGGDATFRPLGFPGAGCPPRSTDPPAGCLLAAWTAKEALFKASGPANQGRTLLDVHLTGPAAPMGRAIGPAGSDMAYVSAVVSSGCLSVAVGRNRPVR
ncbi:MAG: 4'-phosphopantetheinyl transferase family protein [Acidimicrobiales bacterium]